VALEMLVALEEQVRLAVVAAEAVAGTRLLI
jgi:hypothetical protein